VAPKRAKIPGKSAKRGTKPQSSARPVRKSVAKPAKKAAAGSGRRVAKPVAKKSAPKAAKAVAKRPAAKKATERKPAVKHPAARSSAAVKSAAPRPKAKAAAKPLAPIAPRAKAAATARSARTSHAPQTLRTPPITAKTAPPPNAPHLAAAATAQRHPQRRPEAPAATAKGAVKAGPAATATPPLVNPTSRSVSAVRTLPAAKRPFSRESVRVGESRFAQPTGARPVFPAEFLQRQRERLLVKKQEILAMYQKDLRSGQESNDSPTEDLVDRANNAYTRELAFSISDSERELMRQIDLAIERLNSGSYGFCLHTGQQIGQARLEALPWAKYSVEAQELLEKGLLSEA
jgi:DnaK suppressor protein